MPLLSSLSSPSETQLWRAGTIVVLVEAVFCFLEIAAHVSVFDCDVVVLVEASDVPGQAWAQASGLGRAFKGSGLRKVKPDPKLTARLGLGLVRLEPGLP